MLEFVFSILAIQDAAAQPPAPRAPAARTAPLTSPPEDDLPGATGITESSSSGQDGPRGRRPSGSGPVDRSPTGISESNSEDAISGLRVLPGAGSGPIDRPPTGITEESTSGQDGPRGRGPSGSGPIDRSPTGIAEELSHSSGEGDRPSPGSGPIDRSPTGITESETERARPD